ASLLVPVPPSTLTVLSILVIVIVSFPSRPSTSTSVIELNGIELLIITPFNVTWALRPFLVGATAMVSFPIVPVTVRILPVNETPDKRWRPSSRSMLIDGLANLADFRIDIFELGRRLRPNLARQNISVSQLR